MTVKKVLHLNIMTFAKHLTTSCKAWKCKAWKCKAFKAMQSISSWKCKAFKYLTKINHYPYSV